ncbi:MAG: hypothetical protein WAK53_16580 [Chromatiaceae bacterium]
MRRFLKFLHTMGTIGLMGALAALLVLLAALPDPTTSLSEYASLRTAMGGIAAWLLLPSLALVLVSGLWSMAITRAFHNAGWVLAKLALGVVMFKDVLLSVQGPVQTEAARSAQALAGELDPAVLGTVMHNEWAAVWVVLLIATANVVLGVWRPKFSRRRQARAKAPNGARVSTAGSDTRPAAQSEDPVA